MGPAATLGPSAPAWAYELGVTNPGTRSEGRVGILLFDGDPIGLDFSYIYIPSLDAAYEHVERERLWDFLGYRPAARREYRACPRIGEDAIARGWLRVLAEARPEGLPSSWVYGEFLGTAFWLDPRRIDELIIAEGLVDEGLMPSLRLPRKAP